MSELIDYNGEGKWSRDAILDRYARYYRALGIVALDLSPMEHVEGERKWIYPVMDKVIEGIERGDAACKLIGIEFIEEDGSFPFGKTLKSNTARALRRTQLTDEDNERIRRRVVHMLVQGNVPHEYKEYAKLLKRIGLGDHRRQVESKMDSMNPWAANYARYLLGP